MANVHGCGTSSDRGTHGGMPLLWSMVLPVLLSSCSLLDSSPFELGKAVKLGECDRAECEFIFRKPMGAWCCQFVFLSVQGRRAKDSLVGEIVLQTRSGAQHQVRFGPDNVMECTGWCRDDYKSAGGAAYVVEHIDWRLPPGSGEPIFAAGGQHKIWLRFERTPPEGLSLWVNYFPWYYALRPII